MKHLLAIVCVLTLTTSVQAAPPQAIDGVSESFSAHNVEGCILIYSSKEQAYYAYNQERCNTGFLPASTFKIVNTLLAIETGVATPETIFEWGGETRYMKDWEKNMTLAEAYKLSCVPVYQQVARQIGTTQMQAYLRLLAYGRMVVDESTLDTFWLEGKSTITAYQQLYFLKQLHNKELPVSDSAMEKTIAIMLNEATPTYMLYAKTGFASNQGYKVGWYVGFIEVGENTYYFATNLTPLPSTADSDFLQARKDITKEVFRLLHIIPE